MGRTARAGTRRLHGLRRACPAWLRVRLSRSPAPVCRCPRSQPPAKSDGGPSASEITGGHTVTAKRLAGTTCCGGPSAGESPRRPGAACARGTLAAGLPSPGVCRWARPAPCALRVHSGSSAGVRGYSSSPERSRGLLSHDYAGTRQVPRSRSIKLEQLVTTLTLSRHGPCRLDVQY